MANPNTQRKGFFMTIDVVLSLLVLFLAIALAFYYFTLPSKNTLSSLVVRSSLQDAASLMAQKGVLGIPLQSGNKTDMRGVREIFRNTPDSICMQVSVYNSTGNLSYVVSKDRCPYNGGEVQSLTFPFAYNIDQDNTGYYTAVVKAWPKGVS